MSNKSRIPRKKKKRLFWCVQKGSGGNRCHKQCKFCYYDDKIYKKRGYSTFRLLLIKRSIKK